jgi:predicted secreted acid phosphatase
MKNRLLVTLFAFSLFIGCKTQSIQSKNEIRTIKKEIVPTRAYSVQAVLWQQHAAEYRALAHQAFYLAQIQLDAIIANKKETKILLAIVTDIYETVLNNSTIVAHR